MVRIGTKMRRAPKRGKIVVGKQRSYTRDLELQQLQRWANTQRLEGNYVAAQATERLIAQLQHHTSPLAAAPEHPTA